jgi:hypothetical protein
MKADTPKRYTLGVAVAANQPDVAVALDGFRDFLRPDTVEASAWGYMAKSREVGIQHSDGTEGHGVVVESYIYRGPDWTLVACDGSTQVIKAGDWLLGTVWDEQTWPLIEAGILNGHSVDGKAQRAPVTAAEADELRSGRGR